MLGYWDTWYSFWQAVRKRVVAAGGTWYPESAFTWDTGKISAASATTVTIVNLDDTPKVWSLPGVYNMPWTSRDLDYAPTEWDLIIHDCDPKKVIRAEIDTWNETGTLTLRDTYSLDRRVDERVMLSLTDLIGKRTFTVHRKTDSRGWWWSERLPQWPNTPALEAGINTAATATSLTDELKSWSINQWIGRDVVYLDSTDRMRRSRITGNTATTLQFASGGWTPKASSDYYILAADAYFQWGRTGEKLVWYTGHRGGDGHQYWTHRIGDSNSEPTGLSLKPSNHFDYDRLHGFEPPEDYSDYERFTNVRIARSFRQIQVAIEELVGAAQWVDPNLVIHGRTDINIPILTWADLGPWHRWVERRFQRMYPKTVFIPAIDPYVVEEIVYPPTSDYPGQWLALPASGKYCEHNDSGFLIETDSLVSGQLARYVGSSFNDPTCYPWTYDASLIGGKHPVVNFHARKAVFVRDSLPSGIATEGGDGFLTDANMDLWPSGVMRTEEGTASSGGTTWLQDASKSGSGFWLKSRHGDGSGTEYGWEKFTIEIEQSPGVWHKRPVTAHNGTRLDWSDPLPFSAVGKNYRIREPYELNEWTRRELVLTDLDLNQQVVTITHNDDHTLWFAESVTVEAGWSWAIRERQPGTTWKWNGSAWVTPTGIDPRNNLPYPADQTAIVPTVVQASEDGRLRLGDALVQPFFDQINAKLAMLTRTKTEFYWVTPEEGNNTGSAGPSLVDDDTFDWGAWGAANWTLYTSGEPPQRSAGFTRYPGEGVPGAYSVKMHGQGAIPTGLPCRITGSPTFYVYPTIDEYNRDPFSDGYSSISFDDYGGTLLFRAWTSIGGGSEISPGVYRRFNFGSNGLPPDPGMPADPEGWWPDPPHNPGYSRAWWVYAKTMIVDW